MENRARKRLRILQDLVLGDTANGRTFAIRIVPDCSSPGAYLFAPTCARAQAFLEKKVWLLYGYFLSIVWEKPAIARKRTKRQVARTAKVM